jgi:predicted N-acetyltransferase YhbS
MADEVFMAIELRAGALQNKAGIARYRPEFNEV